MEVLERMIIYCFRFATPDKSSFSVDLDKIEIKKKQMNIENEFAGFVAGV